MGKLKDLNDSPNRQKYSSGTQQSQQWQMAKGTTHPLNVQGKKWTTFWRPLTTWTVAKNPFLQIAQTYLSNQRQKYDES